MKYFSVKCFLSILFLRFIAFSVSHVHLLWTKLNQNLNKKQYTQKVINQINFPSPYFGAFIRTRFAQHLLESNPETQCDVHVALNRNHVRQLALFSWLCHGPCEVAPYLLRIKRKTNQKFLRHNKRVAPGTVMVHTGTYWLRARTFLPFAHGLFLLFWFSVNFGSVGESVVYSGHDWVALLCVYREMLQYIFFCCFFSVRITSWLWYTELMFFFSEHLTFVLMRCFFRIPYYELIFHTITYKYGYSSYSPCSQCTTI